MIKTLVTMMNSFLLPKKLNEFPPTDKAAAKNEGLLNAFNRRVYKALASLVLGFGAVTAPAAAEQLPDLKNVMSWTFEEQVVGYKSVEKLLPVGLAAPADNPRPLPKSTVEVPPQIAAKLKTFMAGNQAVGLLIMRRGEIMYEQYAFGFKPEDRWTSFSMAKSITSTLVGAAVKDGYIKSIDDPVSAYLPELSGSRYDQVTIRHLLTMSSGTAWNEDYSDPQSDVSRLALGVPDPDFDLITHLKNAEAEAEPGSRFIYSTGESGLLGLLVQRATGRGLAEYLSEKIWRPCGMETEAIWAQDGQGRESGGCCFSATLRDYGRFALFFLDEYKGRGQGVLPEGWARAATSPSDVYEGYGYQWWLDVPGAYSAHGIFGQLILTDPENEIVVVILSAWPTASSATRQESRRLLAIDVGPFFYKQ